MALITCPECGSKISEFAESCPTCGCPAKLWKVAPSMVPEGLQAGDRISLGIWEDEPLEWRVLEAGEDAVYVLCETGVDCQPFNANGWSGNDWSSSTLKKWLNNTFLIQAFTGTERAAIREITCLTDAEADRFFAGNAQRICHPGRSAMRHFAYFDEDIDGCCWWLSTSADDDMDAMYVDAYGRIHPYGCGVSDGSVCVRPALRVAR